MRRMIVAAVAAAALTAAAAPAAGQAWSLGFDDSPDHHSGDGSLGLGPRGDLSGAYGRAVADLKAKNYRDAARKLGALVDAAPGEVLGWRLLGVAYAGEGRWDASRRAYEHAIRLAPGDILSHAGRGEALLALKDPRAAEEADWLRARASACAGACPEAPLLKTLEATGPFAARAS